MDSYEINNINESDDGCSHKEGVMPACNSNTEEEADGYITTDYKSGEEDRGKDHLHFFGMGAVEGLAHGKVILSVA